MTEKHKKIFVRILIVTATVWALGVLLLDIALPLLMDRLHDPNEPYVGGHGGVWVMFGSPLCVLVVVVSYFVLRIRSCKDDLKQNNDTNRKDDKP